MSEQTAKKEEDEKAGSQEDNQEQQKKEESSGQSLDAIGLGPAVGMELTEEYFKQTCLEVCRNFLEEKGGPTQYLKHELGGSPNDKWVDFAKDLEAAFPKRPDLVYLPDTQAPGTMKHFMFRCGT